MSHFPHPIFPQDAPESRRTMLHVNPSLTLGAFRPRRPIPPRQPQRAAWVIDRHQVSEDKRSGIKSDANRADDPEYIVRLVGQVVKVSLETVRIVKGLPEKYAK
jgi:hypothetical protein